MVTFTEEILKRKTSFFVQCHLAAVIFKKSKNHLYNTMFLTEVNSVRKLN